MSYELKQNLPAGKYLVISGDWYEWLDGGDKGYKKAHPKCRKHHPTVRFRKDEGKLSFRGITFYYFEPLGLEWTRCPGQDWGPLGLNFNGNILPMDAPAIVLIPIESAPIKYADRVLKTGNAVIYESENEIVVERKGIGELYIDGILIKVDVWTHTAEYMINPEDMSPIKVSEIPLEKKIRIYGFNGADGNPNEFRKVVMKEMEIRKLEPIIEKMVENKLKELLDK